MSQILSNTLSLKIRKGILQWLTVGMLVQCAYMTALGQTIEAYARPKEDYNYIFTLDHVYETTLFRSEQFEPLVETEDGYIILLQLGGKPNLVLLPFQAGDRKVAEKKHRGVGVTYTAYLSFKEGYLPFFADQYYEVIKREKGFLQIEYNFQGFKKTIEVPEYEFVVKSVFEYHLEESLVKARNDYHKLTVTYSTPEQWPEHNMDKGPGTMTESPTHVGIVRNTILATDHQSIRTSPASELQGVASEVRVDRQKLLVVPIVYTHETLHQVHYFVNVLGYNRPVLIKDFTTPDGSDGYKKVVRVSSNSAQDVRYLEITESMNIEFYPNFHFLTPGELAPVRKGHPGLYLNALDGEYEISTDDIELHEPKAFLQMWETKINGNQLDPEDKIYHALLSLRIPPVVKSDKEWQLIQKLQALAQLNINTRPNVGANLQAMNQSLTSLEAGAERLGLSLLVDPRRTFLQAQNFSYFHFWKIAFDNLNAQAVREGNQDMLRRQILRSKLLINDTQHQALVNFLSAQIFTYSNYLPAPLNRINQLDTNPPLAASTLMVFKFPLRDSFKLNPSTFEPIALTIAQEGKNDRLSLKEKFGQSWLLDIDILKTWQAAIISKKEQVYDPAYWTMLETKEAIEKEKKLQIARKRLMEAQTKQIEDVGFLKSPEAPWVASAIWLVIILMTNAGFFALAKAMPIKQT